MVENINKVVNGYLTRSELMKILQVKSSTTITTYIKQGMPCIKINERTILFDLDEVVSWLKNKER